MRTERVLFVDDEPALVALTVRGLGRRGYRITGCSDPVQALAAFRATPEAFDAVITDLAMPAMSGFTLARQVHEIRSNVPIVIMSGFVSADDEATSTACNIREIILKPITLDKLGDALDRLFAASDPPEAS
jgi:DNA-binding NtrC family response regulator